ncbi:unnamed protein product, partial [Closterium sp. Naga37s-1]
SITRHTFARHSLHAFVCPPRRPRSPPRRPRFPSPVALAPLPAALASPPRRPRFPSPSPSLPLPVALASPPRRPRFPTPSPSLPLPVALASPPRRPRFPSPSPSLPVSVALASPPRRPRFPSPSPSLPLPVTLASPAIAVSLALAPPARNPHLPIHLRMVESAGLFADYLASLPAAQLDRLYSSLYTCQATLPAAEVPSSASLPQDLGPFVPPPTHFSSPHSSPHSLLCWFPHPRFPMRHCNPTTLPAPHSHRTTPPSFPPRMLLASLANPLSPLPLPQLSLSCRAYASLTSPSFIPFPSFLPQPRIHVTPSSGPAGSVVSAPPHRFLPQCTSNNPQHPHTHLPPFLPSSPFLHLVFSAPTSVRPPSHHRSPPLITGPCPFQPAKAVHAVLPLLVLPPRACWNPPPFTLTPPWPHTHPSSPPGPCPHQPSNTSLPPLAKQYVLRLLFLTDPVPAALVADWPKPEAHSKHKAALDRLQQLRLLLACSETGSLAAAASSAPAAFRLNPTFQQQLQQALTSGAPVSRPSVPASVATRLPSAAELAAHATSHWEAVLMHLISPPSIAGGHGAAVITRVLVRAGLLTHSGCSLSVVSTSAFPFLLKDRNEQLWAIVSSYIESAQDRGHDSGDVIAFLLELGFHNIGTPYSMATLTGMQQEVVEEIAQLGFVLTQKGFIVVETNFRVYAYTQSKLQAEILSLFMRLEYRLPNLVVGIMNRETVNNALALGIVAEQIVQYMRKNAHPLVATKPPVVPETVVDQIRLWEFDRNRVATTAAVLYDDFPTQEVFEAIVKHAQQIGALLWKDSKKRKFVVRADAHDSVRTFIRHLGSKKKRRIIMASATPNPLLTPFTLPDGTELSMRIVYAPLTRDRAVGTIPQPNAATYYSQRAHKGGLMLTEGTCISPEAHGYPDTPGIYTEAQIAAWKPVIKAVHDKGARFYCQLWHVGRASHQEYQPDGAAPMAPSAIPIISEEIKVYISTGPADYPTPRAMTAEEIKKVVEQFRVAARNAIDAGFDGVEVHGANGYLLEQFIKDGINKREDEFGGSLENRLRFPLQVIKAVADEVGASKVGVRLSPYSSFLDASDSDPVGTYLGLVEAVNSLGLAYVHFIEARAQGNADLEDAKE